MDSGDPYDLSRFLDAQATSFATALAELHAGAKRGHWMWWIFPQLSGLGSSPASQRFGISSLDEARAYLAHPVLGARLRRCCEALLNQPERDAVAVLGPIDAQKLKSSMTLFGQLQPDACFDAVLAAFSAGERDALTLARLSEQMQR